MEKKSSMEKMVKNNFFENKKILITGNTGFLGSWLTLFLLSKKSKIFGISNSCNKKSLFKLLNLKNKINHFNFDLKDKTKVKKFFKNKNIDIVIHLAAEPLVYKSFKFPRETIENNFLTTINLLNELKSSKSKLFVNFTTDKVYKNLNKKKMYYQENSELFGSDPYSFSKSCSDMAVKMWSENIGNISLKYINVRCGNIIGGSDWSKKRIVTDINNSLFKSQNLILRNPNSTRPWIHVFEVCNYLLELIRNNEKIKHNFSAWNIAPNKKDNKSVKWLAKKFLRLHSNKIKKIRLKKSDFKENLYLNIDNSKIKKFIKKDFLFKIDQRIYLTYEWYKYFFFNKKELNKYSLKQVDKFIF